MSIVRRFRPADAGWLLLFVLLLWSHPLLTLKLAHQGDFWVHLRGADQFLAALREGWLLPRWAYAPLDGLGDPTFFYYQPLYYYVSSMFALLGLGPRYALLCSAMTPFVLLGAIVCFGALGRYGHRKALLGAIFVIGGPTLFFLATHIAGLPWLLSLPFSLLFAMESTREKPRAWLLAVMLCLVCLSHLLSAMMTLCCVGLARLIFAFPSRRNVASHLQWGLGVVLGLGLAAFFVYPAVSQLHLISPQGWTDGATFDWRRAFIFPTLTYFMYGLRWGAIQWPMAVLALAMCFVVLAQRTGHGLPGKQLHARRLAWMALAALALGSELAYPVYLILPPLQKLQFPYRFLFLGTVLASVALMIHLNEGAWQRWSRPMRAMMLLLLCAQVGQAALVHRSLYLAGEEMPDRPAFMAKVPSLPEYVPAVRGPKWKEYVDSGKLDGECKQLGIRCTQVVHHTHDFSVVVDTSRVVQLRLPIFAFPAWRISVDGKPQTLVPDPATGFPVVDVAPGHHLVAMHWSRLPAEIAGLTASAISLSVVLGMAALGRRRMLLKAGRTEEQTMNLSTKRTENA